MQTCSCQIVITIETNLLRFTCGGKHGGNIKLVSYEHKHKLWDISIAFWWLCCTNECFHIIIITDETNNYQIEKKELITGNLRLLKGFVMVYELLNARTYTTGSSTGLTWPTSNVSIFSHATNIISWLQRLDLQ